MYFFILDSMQMRVVWWVKYNTQVDTKMLASDWLLFIAANQKPAFWCRQCRCGENVGEGLKTCWRRSLANQNPSRHRPQTGDEKKRPFCVKNVKTHHGACVDGRLHWEQQRVHRSQPLHNTDSRVQVVHSFTNPSFLCTRQHCNV